MSTHSQDTSPIWQIPLDELKALLIPQKGLSRVMKALGYLNVKGMMKNRHLSKAIAQMNWFSTRTKLTSKCKEQCIEVRVVSRFYPSSKTCSSCGQIKKDLTLKDRTYDCQGCGLIMDRDVNAALNLKQAVEYSTA